MNVFVDDIGMCKSFLYKKGTGVLIFSKTGVSKKETVISLVGLYTPFTHVVNETYFIKSRKSLVVLSNVTNALTSFDTKQHRFYSQEDIDNTINKLTKDKPKTITACSAVPHSVYEMNVHQVTSASSFGETPKYENISLYSADGQHSCTFTLDNSSNIPINAGDLVTIDFESTDKGLKLAGLDVTNNKGKVNHYSNPVVVSFNLQHLSPENYVKWYVPGEYGSSTNACPPWKISLGEATNKSGGQASVNNSGIYIDGGAGYASLQGLQPYSDTTYSATT